MLGDTLTGRHLDDRARLKDAVRAPSGAIEIRDASMHNLRHVDVDVPLGVLVVVTGVAKVNGVKPALFSANSEGACPTCNGAGVIYTELGFMDTVATVCDECGGKRFEASVLQYKLGGRDISEVLEMSVAEAEGYFADGEARTPAAHAILRRLRDVGLGYVSLGQPLTTLSGGERQRLKLASDN